MNMSDQITVNTVELVQKLDDMPVQKFEMILPYKDYAATDITNASLLLSDMLKWAPKERIDCKTALEHAFFKGVKGQIEDK